MLRGRLSGASALGGALSASDGLDGRLTVGGGTGYPVYDGETEWVPSESEQTIDTHGKALLADIIVDAVPSTYVGSAVDRRDSDDLAASGATVTAPAGYYAEPASKAVASGSITMRKPTMDEAAGEIRSRADLTTGYVTGGSYSGSALILDKQAGTTITPTESEQVAVAQYRWTTGAVKVAAIPSQYIVPTGTYTVTGSGTHDVTAHASASVASATPTNSSDSEYITSSGSRKWRYRPKTIVPTAGWADQHSASNPINGFWVTYDAIPTGTTVTPTTSAQTIGGADTMMEDAVTVSAVPTGTEGTPSAAKSVSGHTATVTPSVTNVAGYIDGGTHTGAAVTVAASELVSGTKPIAANGTGIDVTEYAAVDVAVPVPTPSYQSKSKSYTPTETAQSETVSPDTGYDGLSSVAVSVGAISSTYVGSGITRRDSSSLSASGATVSVPAGYYENAASKAVSSGSATAPSSVSATGASISYGLTNITLSKANVSITPTVTPGYVSSGTAGNATVYLSAPAEFQAETDWHPSTSDQNILAGKILSGTQHIKAVTMANLDAGNIKDGVTVKIGDASDDDCVASVTGTYTGGGGSVKTATGTFTGNGTRTIDVACTFEPDIVYFTSNPGTTASSGTVAAIIVRDMMTATRYRNNSTTNSHYAIPDIADLNTGGSSYSWRATYANSKVTLYCYSSNARGLLTNGRTYTYTFIKWT